VFVQWAGCRYSYSSCLQSVLLTLDKVTHYDRDFVAYCVIKILLSLDIIFSCLCLYVTAVVQVAYMYTYCIGHLCLSYVLCAISGSCVIIIVIIIILIIIIRQFVRRHSMLVDITRAPFRQKWQYCLQQLS